jgi:hypothetical protein
MNSANQPGSKSLSEEHWGSAADAKLERKKRAEREPNQRFNRSTDQPNMPITFYQKPS